MLRSRGRNGRREKGTCTHGRRGVSETELHGDSNRRQESGQRPAASGLATAGRGVAFSVGAVFVATKADARSIVGEPDPRSFSSEYAGKRRPLRRRLNARNWMLCGSHRAGEEILSSGQVVRCPALRAKRLRCKAGRAVHECNVADRILSRIWRSVSTSCPPQVRS